MTELKPFLAPIAVAVVALAGLSSCQDTAFREGIEDKLTGSSAAALAEAGIDGADVSFVGRDGTVEAGTDAVASAAGAVVEGVEGVRVVTALGPDGEVEIGGAAGSDADGAASGDATAEAGAEASAEASEDAAADDPAGEDEASSDDGGSASGDEGSASDDDGSSDDGGAGDESGDAGSEDSGEEDSGSGDETEEPTAKEKKEAQEELEELVEIETITFVTDSARLTSEGAAVVRDAAELLEEHPNVTVRIEGHTDHVGATSYNRELSQDRAETVLDRLVRLGVDESRLTARGYGESDPVVENPRDLAELEKNRRVEFVVTD
ncbi:OmpA family protein [Myceligenerans crystallogenes]|uniref:OmpA-like domain-containing protein n=1 Tax=Myceligenerans crystallogenes TaxID=316335 RepID=A0ABN2NG30_9MICO